MAEWAPRVVWSAVSVAVEGDGFGIRLDGRPVRTPAKRPLTLPTRALAEAVAAEWAAQRDRLDPTAMPVTRAANAAIDRVAPHRAEVVRTIAAYGETDLLCHRAASPRELAERQRLAWDPLLDWAAEALGARLTPVAGLMPAAQDAGALAALTAHVAGRDPFTLNALGDLVSLSGSLVLGLAVLEGRLTPLAGWEMSRIDETFQQEKWGVDAEAAEAEAAKHRAFEAAHRFAVLASR